MGPAIPNPSPDDQRVETGEPEPPRSQRPGLRAREAGVTLWWRAEPPECRATDLELLDAAERERAARFVFARDRALFASAHALLRRALGAKLGAAPRELRFGAERRGKPLLEHPADGGVAFNLSHTRGASLTAMGPVAELGVDVESGASLRDPLELAPSVFHPAEREWLGAGLDEADLRARFLRLWTLKEAYLKARGWGLGGGPATWKLTEIRIDPEALALLVDTAVDPAPERWYFEVGELESPSYSGGPLSWALAWRA
ncbi:MAG: 4'-phosphopantetheinyl transferase family protein [Planctomycetota bacterium]|jgi:4'-phosphopantetheinyl transferase